MISHLSNSLKILEKIQKDLETSAKNNFSMLELNEVSYSETSNINNNLNVINQNLINTNASVNINNNILNLNIAKQNIFKSSLIERNSKISSPNYKVDSPFSDYSIHDLNRLGLSIVKINDKLHYLQPTNLSEMEKEKILRTVNNNSDERLKNFSNLFSLINGTLKDINKTVNQINNENKFQEIEYIGKLILI